MYVQTLILTLFAQQAFASLVHPLINNTKEDYTIERANKYIADNKASVDQTYRLKYHAMGPIGWINDPNGLCQINNEYHLFYQFYPYDSVWGAMHWGHAKSSDLIAWEDLPVAMAPDQPYDNGGVFSGSAIAKDGKLYVVYTCVSANLQQQCVAVSSDNGTTFTKLPQNPVITSKDLPSNAQPGDFRDPKVFERNGTYYVVTASKTTNNTGQILLFASADLVQWTFKSVLLAGTAAQGVMWECPDLFELDGKDVLILSAIGMPKSGNEYWNPNSVVAFIGTVDWTTFTFNVESQQEVDHGLDFYATQSMSDARGRRILFAWMSGSRNFPTHDLGHKWAGSMSLPRVLGVEDGRLTYAAVGEINDYVSSASGYARISLQDETARYDDLKGEVGVFQLTANVTDAKTFRISLRMNDNERTDLVYERESRELSLNREASGVAITGGDSPNKRTVTVPVIEEDDGLLDLLVYLDQSTVEVYVNGLETMSASIYPTQTADGFEFQAEGSVYIYIFGLSVLSV